MSNEKNYSDEMLKKYISSEISNIEKERTAKRNWKRNEDFRSQVSIRKEGDQNVS